MAEEPPKKQAYFGDLHTHTQLSMGAFLSGTRITPDEAYRFAKGEPIERSSGGAMQLDRPLDFYAITDQAAYLGLFAAINTPEHPLYRQAVAQAFVDSNRTVEPTGPTQESLVFAAKHRSEQDSRAAWQQLVDAAEAHNQPGSLTTFVGFEYGSFRDTGDVHRNVIFQSSRVAKKPYSQLDSLNPENLWHWMDDLRAKGTELLSIPHSSNGSDGRMFDTKQFDGSAVTPEYAAQRLRNEPLVAVTHGLSGLSGLTGVWAQENSRAAIYAALRRKETFATTGTRISLRMFAGFRFPDDLHKREDRMSIVRKRGVLMGGSLERPRGPLMISAEAMRDAAAAPLQRLQVVKGWVENGESFEKVFDIACAGRVAVNAATQRCPDNLARVDLVSCEPRGSGAATLVATWTDTEFNPKHAAFYYVRAIENPTCRGSSSEAMHASVTPGSGANVSVQQRAYSSPVWFSPAKRKRS